MRQHQQTADLLAHGGNHFEFSSGMRVRGPVLDVDHAHTRFAPPNGRGQERFERILWQIFEVLEPGIVESLP
jgi:hypothetical protein